MIYVTSTRCKICQSSLRERIDARLLGEERKPGGMSYKYEEIVQWAATEGLDISVGGLSRHRNNHLLPALGQALETQQVMDAISRATGKQLSLHSAVVNVIAHKALRLLEDTELEDLDPIKALNLAVRSAEVALRLEKTERLLTEDVAKKVEEKLSKQSGITPEVLRVIREELYGITP
ncbi:MULTISPECIES: phage protein Gp27 family protein [unclassified Meiothermus]|uniref:phage protein Gp27 family protein n=1 Tax=unclassified Meiothermus TaxID=370471 RepID=UPI001314D15C|nr:MULTISPECIES: phage protein Gp27 family protein [unclassified Meiothermus]